MVKAISCVKRTPATPVEDFQKWWRARDLELVGALPGVLRYVQSHTLPSGYRKREPAYDGIAELWADDVSPFLDLVAAPGYAGGDGQRDDMLDPTRLVTIVVEDVVIKDGPISAEGVKNVEFVRRRPDMDVERFHAYWREVHGPIAAEIPVLRRYVQSHTVMNAYRADGGPPLDGCAITWFDSIGDMRQSAMTAAYVATRADEPNFLECPLAFVITQEHVLLG
jgi:uncharacterized protein (TIGR02118 family)